ncbi:MAG TPA: efflux RND transporter periplasmic adaptor subunit [Casimicrobiaceae bacterium]|nr:efflux RND transporter periplasmic adaptor subunit [Casimicrobiaceae bacterium]
MISPRLVAKLTIALLVVLGAAAAVWYLVLDKAVGTYTVVRGDLLQSVVASGQVITPARASIAAEITGRVVSVPVAEGDTVRRGQILVELDQTDERAALDQAHAALAQADARLRQIQQTALPAAEQALRQAQANLTQAQRAWQRTSDLVAQNFVSHAQLDDAQRNLDVAQSQLRAAELQVASERPGGSDFVLAQTARRAAETAIGAAQAKLDATVIRAPADGVLIGRSVEPGDVAQAGKALMVIAPAGETQIVVNIDEKNLGKLAIGQQALVSADAFPGESFPAVLFYLNLGIDPVRGAIEAKLRVPRPPAYLRQDMTVSVDIEVGMRKNVLVAPADAVHDADTAHPWVLAVRHGRAARQPVTLGMRGDAAIEIATGASSGDELVPVTNGIVTAGQRVRPVPIRRQAP